MKLNGDLCARTCVYEEIKKPREVGDKVYVESYLGNTANYPAYDLFHENLFAVID